MSETVAFAAALTLPETIVGGYENTGWDLAFHFFAPVVAAVVIALRHRGRKISARCEARNQTDEIGIPGRSERDRGFEDAAFDEAYLQRCVAVRASSGERSQDCQPVR